MTGHNGQVVDYARVSAADQNEARQFTAIGEVDPLFSEKVSGKSTDRPQLQEMLAYVREGVTILVKSPDRLARSTTDSLGMVVQLKSKGAALEFVDNPALNAETPQGSFMLAILAAVAELERATIRERQAEGIAIAKADGKYAPGPKPNSDQLEQAHERVAAGVTKARVARDLGRRRQMLHAALSGAGRYAVPVDA